jgi:hypothetical protein
MPLSTAEAGCSPALLNEPTSMRLLVQTTPLLRLHCGGNAAHIQTCSRQASESEIDAANRRAVETARKAGPFALLKYLGVFPRDAPDPSKIKWRKDL